MSSAECNALAIIHDKVKPPTPLQGWVNIPPAGGFAKVACCTWKGIQCDTSSGTVTQMYLGSAGLMGSIPPEIGVLTGLQDLNMFQNSLTGSIPPELESLTNLKIFAFGGNNLTGTIPEAIKNWKSLNAFVIDKNQISGTLPSVFGNLASLKTLNLGENSLSGTLPPQLFTLNSLNYLNLDLNKVSGTIPPEIGSCRSLKSLYIWKNNINGELPIELFNLKELEVLAIDTNSLSGAVPTNIKELKALTSLDLRGNSFTSLPAEITEIPLQKCKIDGNPYTCHPNLPTACEQPTTTASKCPAPTGGSKSSSGTLNSHQLLAILASAIGVIVLVVVGVFGAKRRKATKKMEKEYKDTGFENKENEIFENEMATGFGNSDGTLFQPDVQHIPNQVINEYNAATSNFVQQPYPILTPSPSPSDHYQPQNWQSNATSQFITPTQNFDSQIQTQYIQGPSITLGPRELILSTEPVQNLPVDKRDVLYISQ